MDSSKPSKADTGPSPQRRKPTHVAVFSHPQIRLSSGSFHTGAGCGTALLPEQGVRIGEAGSESLFEPLLVVDPVDHLRVEVRGAPGGEVEANFWVDPSAATFIGAGRPSASLQDHGAGCAVLDRLGAQHLSPLDEGAACLFATLVALQFTE
jgi:hypothetical protein